VNEKILNLGAGNRIIEGAVNHDLVQHRPEIDIVHDLNILPWPWESGEFNKIEARSVLEHLKLDLIESMSECWRVLEDRGVVVLTYPICTSFNIHHDPTHRWFWSERSIEFLDPTTELGKAYCYYTPRKWEIASSGVIKGRNMHAILVKRCDYE